MTLHKKKPPNVLPVYLRLSLLKHRNRFRIPSVQRLDQRQLIKLHNVIYRSIGTDMQFRWSIHQCCCPCHVSSSLSQIAVVQEKSIVIYKPNLLLHVIVIMRVPVVKDVALVDSSVQRRWRGLVHRRSGRRQRSLGHSLVDLLISLLLRHLLLLLRSRSQLTDRLCRSNSVLPVLPESEHVTDSLQQTRLLRTTSRSLVLALVQRRLQRTIAVARRESAVSIARRSVLQQPMLSWF